MLLLALVFYLHYEAPPEEQNFAMVMEMLRAGAIEDEDDPSPSPLDNLFSDLMIDNPDHIALKYYHSYHSGSSKTLKSIQITLAARLEKFNLESLAAVAYTHLDVYKRQGQNISVTETSTSFYNERQKVQVSLAKAIEKDKTFGIGRFHSALLVLSIHHSEV